MPKSIVLLPHHCRSTPRRPSDPTQLIKVRSEVHEAWQLSGPRGELVVCMPGGKLATWGPRDD